MNKKETFLVFLEILKGHGQDALIESVKKGFQIFYENEEKVITYKGKGITKTFPAGYYRWYSDKEKRFLVYDDLEMAKADIDKELLEESNSKLT
jgi:hypothetical protein